MLFTITRKPWDRFLSNFQRMIITILYICTQRLTEFEIGVKDIFDFFNRFRLGIFPLMHGLPYKSETMRWILLELSKNYYYAAYRFSTFNITLNFSFWTVLNSNFFLLLRFLLEWRFLTLHRTCLHTRAYALTHAHTCVHTHEHAQKQALKPTYTRMLSHTPTLLEHTRNHTYTCTLAHLQAHSCMHMHTY